MNKSFKFQSDWPYNNSQIYLIQPILTDINNDTKRTFEKTSDGYIISSKVNYSTEKDFNKQKVYIDKDKNLTKVEILDKMDNVKMSLSIIDIDYKAKFDDNYFDVSTYHKQYDENSNNKESDSEKENNSDTSKEKENNNDDLKNKETASKIEEVVYPMYIPVDTYLSSQDIVSTSSGERVILTFTGESAFTVVQENLKPEQSDNYVYGDPYLILDTVGSITDYSVSWISNGIEYSIMSDSMNIDELLTVAQSIKVEAIAK